MTAYRLTFDRDGDPVLREDIGGLYPDEALAGEPCWCSAADAAEWNELLLAPEAARERAA